MNKYRAKPTTFNGNKYASKFEAQCAEELEILLKQRKIKKIERQVSFTLIPKPNHIKYIADFVVTTNTGVDVVIESKGMVTDAWSLKKKLFQHFYPQLNLVVWTSKERDVNWLN